MENKENLLGTDLEDKEDNDIGIMRRKPWKERWMTNQRRKK